MSNPLVAQDETAASISAISSFANEFHVIRNWFVEGFKGYAVRLPEVVANSLKKLPEVDFVEQDQVITILGTQKNPPSWGLSRVGTRENGARDYVYPDSAGAGVDAYIVDTGTYIDHPDFEGRASIGASFSTDKNDKDGNGHGTHVSGTVGGSTYGVAKKVRIVAVKVLNSQGSGSNSDVISGIEWVATEAPKRSKKAVANMSLGGGASAALDAALRSAISNGIAFAVAAGNSAGDACKLSPARVAEALTVAASDKNDKLASFSEKGKCVDLIAPGVDITSTWNNGQTNTISGTSMASPHGCGVLALALGESNYTTVKDHKSYVVNIGTRGLIANVPSNTPNILLHADVTVEPQDPLPEPPSEPEDPEEPGDGVCPFPRCLFDPSCTSCCFEGVDC
ncbi:peptidase S8/S53 domain-containing protein [Zopfochytrium polystomum]|nr:peptidase S8/S53 domain-containing protein [Zopfochytrium polystomum]